MLTKKLASFKLFYKKIILLIKVKIVPRGT